MTSNLPPGCSSPDGGIDHAMEAFCKSVETPEAVAFLTALAPLVEQLLDDAYKAGLAEGKVRVVLWPY